MPGYALEVGHVLYVQSASKFFVVKSVKQFLESVSVVLTAGQTLSNQELSLLKSPNDHIYHVRSFSLEDDVNFKLKFRGVDQFGVKAGNALTIDDAPEHMPWPLDLWVYNSSPFYEITENRTLAKTAIVQFNGEDYEIAELRDQDYKGPFAAVAG